MGALFLVVLTLATAAWTGAAQAADDIGRIPRIGFKTVTRVAADGLCGRIADALVAREKINVGEGAAAEAILIVQPLKLELFPKRIASVSELFERLSGGATLCGAPDRQAAALVYEKKPDGSVLRVLKYVLDDCMSWQSGVLCGGFTLVPGHLQVEFTQGSIRSGLAQLRKAFGLAPSSHTQLALSPEQQRAFDRDPDSTLLPADFFVRYDFDVQPRQEEPWAFILNRLPYIEYAKRAPVTVAAVDAARIFTAAEEVNRLPRSPLANATIAIPNAQARSLDFLRAWFGKRGGVLTVVKRDDNRLLVRVDHLRGEVIRQERFWEYLHVNLILIEDQKQTKLYLMNDGYYAAGLGNQVPPDTNFQTMEHDYYSSLTEYTEALATQLQDGLGAHK